MSIYSSEGTPEPSPTNPTESSINPQGNADRKEVFRELVQLQDGGETVERSRSKVTSQFNITHEELLDIEREGVSMNWPPL